MVLAFVVNVCVNRIGVVEHVIVDYQMTRVYHQEVEKFVRVMEYVNVDHVNAKMVKMDIILENIAKSAQ